MKIGHTAAEIHISAALGYYWNALSGCGADSVKHRLIISQLLQKHLRKSATEQQSVHRRQRSVAQRTERRQFGAHFLQYPQTFRIIKRKSFIFGYADLHLPRSRQRRDFRHGQLRRLACQFQQRIDIQLTGNRGMNRFQNGIGGVFGHRQQS